MVTIWKFKKSSNIADKGYEGSEGSEDKDSKIRNKKKNDVDIGSKDTRLITVGKVRGFHSTTR